MGRTDRGSPTHAIHRLATGSRVLERVPVNTDLFDYPSGIALDSPGRTPYVAHNEGLRLRGICPTGR